MRRSLPLLFLAVVLSGCSDSVTGSEEVVLTVYIASYQVDCVGMAPQKCLLVKLDRDAPWTWYYDGIDGFAYEPGFEYELLVRQRTLADPPQDSSSREWRLIAIVSRAPRPGQAPGRT